MKKCIAFDIDRTMIDSYMPEILSLQEAIENITKKRISEEHSKKISSMTTSDFFKSLNLSTEEIAMIEKEWENTYNKYEVKCFPKIKEIIKYLYNKGLFLAIITSRTKEEFHELDDELEDVLHSFKIIITSDLVKSPKPSRDSLDYLCNKLQITPKEIIYIGDSEVDKIFSQNCNLDFIPVCWENKELANEKEACASQEMLLSKINDYINKQ